MTSLGLEGAVIASLLGIVTGLVTFAVINFFSVRVNSDPYGEEVTYMYRPGTITSKDTPGCQWRTAAIQDALANTKEEELELDIIAGECGLGIQETVKQARKAGFSVRVVSGPLPNKELEKSVLLNELCEIERLIQADSTGKSRLYVRETRPKTHMSLIANRSIWIEDYHEKSTDDRYSKGIIRARPRYIKQAREIFSRALEGASPYTCSDEHKHIAG